MNIICTGCRVIGLAFVWELIGTFLPAHLSGAERHQRRLAKVRALENRRESLGKKHSTWLKGIQHDRNRKLRKG